MEDKFKHKIQGVLNHLMGIANLAGYFDAKFLEKKVDEIIEELNNRYPTETEEMESDTIYFNSWIVDGGFNSSFRVKHLEGYTPNEILDEISLIEKRIVGFVNLTNLVQKEE